MGFSTHLVISHYFSVASMFFCPHFCARLSKDAFCFGGLGLSSGVSPKQFPEDELFLVGNYLLKPMN